MFILAEVLSFLWEGKGPEWRDYHQEWSGQGSGEASGSSKVNTLNAQFQSALFTSGGDIFISAQLINLPRNHFDLAKWTAGKIFKIVGVSLGFIYLYFFFSF